MTRDYITIDVCLDEFSHEQIKSYVIEHKIGVSLDAPPSASDFIEAATQIIRRGDTAALVDHVSTYIKDVTGRAVI